MPIATCFLRPDIDPADLDDIVDRWSSASGVAPDHMTVNIVGLVAQHGVGYPIMANLQLPDIWDEESIDRLQLGLARALVDATGIEDAGVHVITDLVATGHVVVGDEIERW